MRERLLPHMTEKETLGIIPIAKLANHLGEEGIEITGWVHTIRDQKKMTFVLVRDETGIAQVTVNNEEQAALAKEVLNLSPESAIRVKGRVVENPIVKLGGIEILPEELTIEGVASPTLPITVKGKPSTLGIRLDWRFLDLRRPEKRFIFEFQTAVEQVMREFWISRGFIEIHSPKLMSAPSESGAELFTIQNYFGRKAYLAQSPQFFKQYAMAAGLGSVFEIGPVFRANPSFTSRHDTEFTSVDVEISWVRSHYDVMAFEEQWLQSVMKRLADSYNPQIRKLYGIEIVVPKIPFPKLTMTEAQEILTKELKHVPPKNTKKGDLDPKGERLLGEYISQKYSHEFVFITDWLTEVRPFYHMRYEDDPSITKSFDLLWKGLEITTGAQREHRYNILVKQAKEKGVDLDLVKFYTEIFRFGAPPHGGFGFGLTRMLMQALGLKNVREVTFLYRGPNRLEP